MTSRWAFVLHTSACGAAVLHASAYGATNDDDVTLGSRAPCFSPWSSQTNVLHVSACGAAMLRAPVSGVLTDDVITSVNFIYIREIPSRGVCPWITPAGLVR